MELYTSEKIGRKQSFTPEGFLLCEDVPIARTGVQMYSAQEVPEIEASESGIVQMDRPADEVFRPETIASVNGKPITLDHPNNLVDPKSWQALAVGVALNARRGKDNEDDLLLADLLVTDEEAIRQVRESSGQQISAGYNYDGVQTARGRGKQTNIVMNHIALVDQARCGFRCSIKDSIGENDEMKLTPKELLGRLREAFQKKDCAAFDSAAKLLDEETQIHVHHNGAYDEDKLNEMFKKNESDHAMMDSKHRAMDERMSAMEQRQGAMDKKMKDEDEENEEEKKIKAKEAEDKKARDEMTEQEKQKKEEEKEEAELKDEMAEEYPMGASDAARKANDSALLSESFKDAVSKAEIIAPSKVHFPAFDSKAKGTDTFKSICGLRRKALQFAAGDSVTAPMLTSITRGRSLDGMKCGQIRTIFDSLAEVKRHANNAAATAKTADTSFVSADGVRPAPDAKSFQEQRKALRDKAKK